MPHIKLDGIWKLSYGQQTQDAPATPQELAASYWPTIEAQVPGNVELDLINAQILPGDIERGDRIYALREFETCRWWYQTNFQTPTLEAGQRLELVLDGLDCMGSIWLNGHEVGQTDNMLIPHRFDVTDFLNKDKNELAVRIDSAVLEGRRHECQPLEFAFQTNWEALNVRKAPHMYGWDIMPRLVSAGLWRSVRLETVEPTRWRSVYWTTIRAEPESGKATLCVDWDFVTDRLDIDDLLVRIRLTRNGRDVHSSEHPVMSVHGRTMLELDNVEFWWPRGSGDQPLYDVTVELLDQNVIDTYRGAIGIRTINLMRTPITTAESPGEFVFVVNGEKIFVKGTNWVPLDALHSRDSQHMKATCEMMADLNCNMVRCWGGNVYEDHEFFDFCDRNGVMVWQDFALSCAIYPQDDDFARRIRYEAAVIVKKLRNHASLALWAGNNEIDEIYSWGGFKLDPNTDHISRKVLAEVVRQLDPMRDYLPSSPYRSPEIMQHEADPYYLKPEDHLWGPRDNFKGPFYTGSPANFVSEIGYHGCPDPASLAEMMDPDYLWPWQDNEQWLTKAVRPHPDETAYNYRIQLMSSQIEVVFDALPDNLNDYALASQISQAEAKKFFIERWR